jgi:hypothetical protein
MYFMVCFDLSFSLLNTSVITGGKYGARRTSKRGGRVLRQTIIAYSHILFLQLIQNTHINTKEKKKPISSPVDGRQDGGEGVEDVERVLLLVVRRRDETLEHTHQR